MYNTGGIQGRKITKTDTAPSAGLNERTAMMKTYEFGNPHSGIVLIQPVDDHDLRGIENEFSAMTGMCETDFHLTAVKAGDWNRDLSPWEAPALFGKEGFGGGASETLGELLGLCGDRNKTYYIGGYSLAGLFALWAAYRTDVFSGVAAASPSVWFPGFTEYMKKNEIKTGTVYLSLGDREEKTRNRVMAAVGDRICEAYALLKDRGVNCILEWNEGNHFKDPDLRTAKAFAWVLGRKSGRIWNSTEQSRRALNPVDDRIPAGE